MTFNKLLIASIACGFVYGSLAVAEESTAPQAQQEQIETYDSSGQLMAAEKKKKKTTAKKKNKGEEPSAPASEAPAAEGEKAAAKEETAAAPASYERPYGMAGCGLGSIVFKNKPGFIQVFAATLNVTGVQTFGITSGTSNCKDAPSAETAAIERKVFVEMNLASLSKDAARGQGEALAAFSELLGCNVDSGTAAEFARVSQSAHGQIFATSNADSVVAGYLQQVRGNGTLNSNCVRAAI